MVQHNLRLRQYRKGCSVRSKRLTALSLENTRLRKALQDSYERLKLEEAYLAKIENLSELAPELRKIAHQLNNAVACIVAQIIFFQRRTWSKNIVLRISDMDQQTREIEELVLTLIKLTENTALLFNSLPELPPRDTLIHLERMLSPGKTGARLKKP